MFLLLNFILKKFGCSTIIWNSLKYLQLKPTSFDSFRVSNLVIDKRKKAPQTPFLRCVEFFYIKLYKYVGTVYCDWDTELQTYNTSRSHANQFDVNNKFLCYTEMEILYLY